MSQITWIIMPPSESRFAVELTLKKLRLFPRVMSQPQAAIEELIWETPQLIIFSDAYPYHGQMLLRVIRGCCHDRVSAIQVISPYAVEGQEEIPPGGVDGFLISPVTLESARQVILPLVLLAAGNPPSPAG